MTRRSFTLDEANGLIPELHKSIALILEKKEAYTRCHDTLFIGQLLHHEENGAGHEDHDLESEIQKMEEAIGTLEDDLNKINAMGCILRNLERGFVDFLSERQGEKIYFCWKYGEQFIQFYHPVKDRTRQRLPLIDK